VLEAIGIDIRSVIMKLYERETGELEELILLLL
jgi:hypothetical protein